MSLLNASTIQVRERLGVFRGSDVFDLIDPESERALGLARERVGPGVALLRLVIGKRRLPSRITIFDGTEMVGYLVRGFSPGRARVAFHGPDEALLATFRCDLMAQGGSITVAGPDRQRLGRIKADWKGWHFSFEMPEKGEVGQITKEWAGTGKELLTSADRYVVDLLGTNLPDRMLLLVAAALVIDSVYTG